MSADQPLLDEAEVERVLETWEHLVTRAGWEPCLTWRVPEVFGVAAALVAGVPPEAVLSALGHRRASTGAGPADLRRDIESLARALNEVRGLPVLPAELLNHATQGMDAAVAATLLESTLVDPETGFETPTSLLSALWTPERGRRLPCDELWVCRWVRVPGSWRPVQLRMTVAGRLQSLLGARDVAVFLSTSSIAVVPEGPDRRDILERELRNLSGLIVTETQTHEIPGFDSLSKVTAWLLEVCPELVGTVLETARSA